MITSLDPVKAALRMFTPPKRPLLGLVYISMGGPAEVTLTGGKVVIDGKHVAGLVLITYLLSMLLPPRPLESPPPEDSDLGLLNGSIIMAEVEDDGGCMPGIGVFGLEEDLPLGLLARLCFLYLT